MHKDAWKYPEQEQGNKVSHVYIVNDGGHDYTEAERFGHLVFCTKGSLDKYDVNQMYRILSQAMEDAQPEDYILITSLASLCSIACAIFAHRFGQLNLLMHKGDHKGTTYIKRTIVLHNSTKDDNFGNY